MVNDEVKIYRRFSANLFFSAGDHSKMSANTKNVFIECTAVDQHKANVVLNIMLTMFAQYCSAPYE